MPDVGARPHVAMVGAGALGTALALRLAQQGYAVGAVISRTETSARRLAERVGAPVAAATPDVLPPAVSLVFCCVPDDRLAAVAAALADVRPDWSGSTVAHTSGALAADVLAPLAMRGARTLGFHPMQTFPPGAPPEAFADVYVGLDGTADAVTEGARIAADLGARSVVIPSEKKALYPPRGRARLQRVRHAAGDGRRRLGSGGRRPGDGPRPRAPARRKHVAERPAARPRAGPHRPHRARRPRHGGPPH